MYGTNGFHPAALVTAGKVIRQDGKRLLPLRVYPFQYNPVAGVLRYHPEIHIQVKIKASGAAAEAEVEPLQVSAAPEALTGASGVLRIRTAGAGMVRLTYDELAAKGVPLATTDVASFALTYLGQSVDIRVLDGNNNHRLDAGELVVFYAEAASGRYNTNNVYFFSYGGAAGSRMAHARRDADRQRASLDDHHPDDPRREGYRLLQRLPPSGRRRITSSTGRSRSTPRRRSNRWTTA